jgi:MGT family glycosyltransferase
VKILFASMPADGHINPLTGIAAHLAQRGHDVRWYAGQHYGARLDRLEMAWFPYRAATEVMAGNLNDLFPQRARLKGPKLIAFELEQFFVSQVDHHFTDLVELREEFPFDVFFCDGAMYVEKLVAERLGVPVLAVSLSTVMPGPTSPPPFFGLRPARHPVDRAFHGVARRMVRATSKRGVRAYNAILERHGVAPVPLDGFPHVPMASARRVFLNGSPSLEFPGYQPPANAEFVGDLAPARTPSAATTLPPAVLESGAQVVVVSQGTVDNTDPGKLIIPTLEALADGPHVVVATTGGVQTAELRARFAGSSHVIVEDYVDYDVLFPHTAAFVSSGGFGSLLAAVRHGVPVIGAGKREGKNDINARVDHNGLGVDLRSEWPKAAAIRKAVDKVVGDPAYAARVAEVRAELEAYTPYVHIEEVLEREAGRARA